MLTSILILSCFGHLLIAFNVPNGLYVASIIIGFCFGANWPVLFSIISKLFGLKYYSTLFNVGSIASPIGSYLLSVRVAGYLYDKEATRQMEILGLKRKQRGGVELQWDSVLQIQLQHDAQIHLGELDVKFQLATDSLEMLLKAMHSMRDQFTTNHGRYYAVIFFLIELE
jgi:hypothetical protein